DPTATNDLPAFNNRVAAVTSATATSIGTQVPSIGTSGKIRVDTPFGTALSQADFFAPPAGKTVADMDLCNLGRMGNPTSAGTSATIGTSGKISELLFDGAGGRRVCINITNPSCTPLGCNLGFELLTPAGDQLYYSGCLVQYCPPTTFFDTATLPTTATYAAVLLPSNSSTTGSANLTVYDVPNDPTQFISLTPSGTSVTLANSSPCQNARAYFPEPGGHRVSVKLTASSGNAGLSLIKG